MKKNPSYKIAIDGPAGSGKSTIAKLLAKQLNFLYIDSGAMYRAVTLYLIQNNLINFSEKQLQECVKKIKIDFKNKNDNQKTYLNKKDVTNLIRTSSVSKFVSKVAASKIVRSEMTKRQKDFGKYKSIIMDGRDIGTNVFSDADLKIYLTASDFVRAKRRRRDLKTLSEKISINDLVKQINDRDNYDSSREISPLIKAQDAIVIDSSDLSISSVLDRIKVFLPFLSKGF